MGSTPSHGFESFTTSLAGTGGSDAKERDREVGREEIVEGIMVIRLSRTVQVQYNQCSMSMSNRR